MHATDKRGGALWRARVNTQSRQKADDCPAWINPAQEEKWRRRGLILWDHQSREVTRLSATEALDLLSYMRATEDWRQEGIVVEEPCMRVFWDGSEPEWKHALAHEMTLSSGQAQEILELLESNESELQRASKIEEGEQEQKKSEFLNLLAEILVRRIREKGIVPGDSE